MPSIFKRDGAWVVKWRDGAGRWRQERTDFPTKLQATNYALGLESRGAYQRAGLTPMREPVRMTFGELFTWYWENDGKHLRTQFHKMTMEKHLRPSFDSLPLADVTTARIEELLSKKADVLAPKSLNHVRGFIHRLFSLAEKHGLWFGSNPAKAVTRRKVPRSAPSYLLPEEVRVVLPEVAPEWQNLFATAVYTGMRRGELIALQKRDVDLPGGTITVTRSWEANTTKSGKPRVVPLHSELRRYLVDAMKKSPSELVFPREDGSMHAKDIKLQRILRGAMNRAGLVDGWILKCRRCGHREDSRTADAKRCPECTFKLWPSAKPRHIVFHSLRHTTVTLLMKAGASLAHASRLVGHSDVRITSDVYGHLDIEDLRESVERLSFEDSETDGAENTPHGAPVVRNRSKGKTKPPESVDFSNNSEGFHQSGRQDLNLRPLGPEPSALPG